MKKRVINLVLIIGLTFSMTGLVFAGSLTGSQVLDKMEEVRDTTSAQLNLSMELYNSAGNKRIRKLKSMSKDKGKEKSLIRFLSPADVEGTGFLSIDKLDSDDEDMYLYLPAFKSIRRVSGSQKNGSFVGTDFSYNDLSILAGGNYKDDYKAIILKENDEQYILRIVPTDNDIEYKYGKLVVRKDNWYPIKVKFYDSKGKLHKVLINHDLKKIDGYWTAQKVIMEDVQQESRTVLYLQEIAYDKPINDRVFTTRNLRRY